MKILSFNIRVWWRDTEKTDTLHYWRFRMEAISDFIRVHNPDIICFQELWPIANRFLPENYRRIGFSLGHSIYVRDDAPVKVLRHRWRLHYDFVELLINDHFVMSLASVHSHWNPKIIQRNCRNILADVARMRSYPVVLVGDWNNTPDVVTPYFEGRKITPKGERHPYSFENWKTGARALLDVFYTRGLIAPEIEYFDSIHKGFVMSDHEPVIMKFL